MVNLNIIEYLDDTIVAKKEEDKIVEIDGEFYTIDKEGKTKKLELKKGG